ncbi:hypothetical protein L7F22_010322 [Adiantum nelumboides]|nr:hypothetical protein [Adiantum nelumboides]
MGLPDIPPPPTSCSLKRCRSEDPSSLADLCSPPPPKLPFSHSPHHLSILQDLESSLNGMPATEAALAPDELVTEMMQSLEKVMGDIEELIAAPGHPLSCDDPRCGGTPTADLPQAQDSLCILDNFAACSGSGLASPETFPNLCRDVAAEGNCDVGCLTTTADSPNSFDDCRGMASDCTDAVSALVESPNAGKDTLSLHVCEEMCERDRCEGLGNVEDGLIDIPGGDLAEQNDGQWSLLDEFCGDFADSALPSNQIDWQLEEGCDLAALISLTQFEEEDLLRHATDNTELLLYGN